MSRLNEYLDWLGGEQGRAPNTVSAYRSDLVAYEQWLGAHPDGDVQAYVEALVDAGRKPASVRRALMAIRAWHRFLGTDTAAAEAEVPEVVRAEPDGLTPDDVDRLLRSLDGRDRALVAVLVDGGLRISEAVGLDLGHVSEDRRAVHVVGHGPRDRTAHLGDRAAAALSGWLAARGGQPGPVFTNARGGRLSRQGAWAIVQARGRQAGLSRPVTPDALRQVGFPHGQRRRIAGHARPA